MPMKGDSLMIAEGGVGLAEKVTVVR